LRNAIEKNGLHNFIIVVFIFDPSYSPPCLDNKIKNKIGPFPSGQGKIEFEKELKRLEIKCIKSVDSKYLYNKQNLFTNSIKKTKANNKKEAKLSLEQYKNNLVVDLIIIPFLKALINKKIKFRSECFRSWSYENIIN
jgi:hypothetical protein